MLLYCDSCDKAFHTFCLKPALKYVPNCGWKCNDCFRCVKCGTTDFLKNQSDDIASENLDYSITKDFSLCLQCAIIDYNSNASEQKCTTCQQKLKYVPEDVDIRECLSCLVKNKKFNKKACTRINCELYLKIHQISTRHRLISLLCTQTLAPFLNKFGNLSTSLIKSFVNENKDFFEEDVVFLDWIHVLEMAVKFENEDTEAMISRGPHKKSITAGASSSQERSRGAKMEKTKKDHQKFQKLSDRGREKLDRKKKKFKKKQIEFIDWYYVEPNDTKVRDLIDVTLVFGDTEENNQFFTSLFSTAFMQDLNA